MSDLLDQYCKQLFGHTDWEFALVDGNVAVTFYKTARPEYLELFEENESE